MNARLAEQVILDHMARSLETSICYLQAHPLQGARPGIQKLIVGAMLIALVLVKDCINPQELEALRGKSHD